MPIGSDRRDKSSLLADMTPIPTSDLRSLSKNANITSTSVVRLEAEMGSVCDKLDAIKDDLIPPISRNAKEARDAGIRLDGRVSVLESKEPPVSSDDVVEIRGSVASVRENVTEVGTKCSWIGKLIWWLLGALVTVGVTAIGFSIYTRTLASTNATKIDSHKDDISRNEAEIRSLGNRNARYQKMIIKEVRSIPTSLQKITNNDRVMTTADDVVEVSDDLPLTKRERDSLNRILKKARLRSKENSARLDNNQ